MRRVLLIFLVLGLLGTYCIPASAVELELGGKSALLMDIETGTVLYEKNAHEPLPPASVTKVMTMLLIMEAIDSGTIRWEDTVTASEAAAAKGGSQIYLKVGETMSVTDMVKSIAVSSANDCACAMAEFICGSESAFVERMNARAEELGMKDTHFVNCTGLDDAPDVVRAIEVELIGNLLCRHILATLAQHIERRGCHKGLRLHRGASTKDKAKAHYLEVVSCERVYPYAICCGVTLRMWHIHAAGHYNIGLLSHLAR